MSRFSDFVWTTTIDGQINHFTPCGVIMHQLNAMVPGHKDTVLMLLRAGARRATVNNMGKNVIQLGSFVGELWDVIKICVNLFY